MRIKIFPGVATDITIKKYKAKLIVVANIDTAMKVVSTGIYFILFSSQ